MFSCALVIFIIIKAIYKYATFVNASEKQSNKSACRQQKSHLIATLFPYITIWPRHSYVIWLIWLKKAMLFLKRAHFARFNVHNSLLYCLRGNCLANESVMTFDAFQSILVINWTNRFRIILKYSKYLSIVSQFYCLFFFVFFFRLQNSVIAQKFKWISVTKRMTANK